MVQCCEIIAIFGVSMKNRLLKSVSGVLFSAFLVFIFSCDNGFSSYSDSSAAVPKSKTHTVNGYISLSGALPDKVIPAASNNSADRSAVPTINTTDYHYFVEAVQTDGPGSYSTEDSSEFITATGGTVSFALHLTDGNWNVTCGVKNSDGETVLSQTLPQPITADETVADLHFIVRPEPRADGTVLPGDIELTASAASPITYATAYCDNAKWKEKTSATGVKALGPDYSLSVTGLESGAYDITFTFYDAQNVIRFQTNQTVNIIPGMKTNKWVSGSASDGAVITSTGFNVTTSLMNGFSRTIYYVGDAAGAASADGEGTAYKPFNSLAKAFTAITQTKNAEKDYTIHLTGTQTAATTMSSGRCFVVPDGIKSLTIVGDSGFSGDVPVATINGNDKGTVIEANSNLILKNVKVTGGKAEGSGSQGYGGGLYIASGKKVSLEKTLIGDAIATTGNAAATSSAGNYGNMAMRGGGIYNDGGELILKSGSYISHNFAIGGFSQGGGGGIYVAGAGSVKINDGAKIILNNGDGRGGGIFVSGTGSVSMSGGNIDYNQIKYNGGGVYCEIENANVNAFEMTGGSISYNKSPNSTGMGEGGGGLYLQKGIFSISGNSLISGNYAKKRGGGICIETDGTVDMSAGVISENWSDGDINGSGSDAAAARSVVNGGAIHNSGILKISGTAYIPYGVTNSSGVLVKGENKNDIFLTSDTKCVTVNGDVSLPAGKSGANATITPCHWTRNIEVLKAGSNIITDAVTSRFKITDGDFKINKNAENTAGKLAAPIYVAGEGFRLCEKTGETGASAAGTKANPYATLGQALDVISGGGAEVIYIDGKITGGNEIPSTFNTATCSELTIKGVSDATHPAFVTVDGKSEPANSLNGGGTERALNIETLVPVILEDIKVTNGSISSGNGSGIYIGGTYNSSSSSITAKANLTLKNVLISGNKITGSTTNANGIGLYAWCADVTMEGGSIIGHDGTNSKDIHGGGVGLGHSKFTMNGGKITGNKVKNYGANVYMNNPDSEFILNDGEISDGLTESSVCDANSGGVWIDGSSTFTMKGGAIKNNTAKFTGSATSSYKAQGGGVYISNGTFDMQGGEMSGNKAEGTGHCGGAVIVYGGSNKSFKMSGDAKIIYGGSSGNNDVYLGYNATNPGKITVSDTLSGAGTVATITPEKWKRGTVVLNATSSGLMTNSVSRFAMADSEFTVNEKSLTGTAVISADIIVGANSSSTYSAATARGTSSDPYKTIDDAISNAVTSGFTTVKVKGTVSGAQTIGTVEDGITDITLVGTGTNPALNGGFTSASKGTTLTVNNSSLAVTIKDLTITGGYAATNGGGINITAGTVKLVNGAKVTGNIAANYGGGVYVAGSSSQLFMSGSSLIGDSATSTTLAMDGTNAGSTTFANKAVKSGGGIYNNGGAVYIGYSGISSGTPVKSDMTSGYGVRRNYAGDGTSTSGGGIQNRSGTLTIASGSISYNQHCNHGGGIYIADGEVNIEAPVTSSNKAKFEGNKALVGGAIYNGKKLTMKAGQIGGSGVQNTVDGTGAMGGAIYQGGSFSLIGSAVVYAGSEKTNDIFLPKPNTSSTPAITYTVDVGTLSTSGTIATITPEEYKRGTKFLSSSSVLSSTVKAQFKLSKDDTGWEKKDDTSSTTKYVYITSPIYVVGASGTGSTKPDGFEYGTTSGANGTKSSPYASIAAALNCADLATVKEITIAGTLVGARQAISSPSVDITLKGYKAPGATKSDAKIQRFSTRYTTDKDNGSALIVNASEKTVTITDLTITYGAALSGAGICITAGTVKLGDYAKINDNYAANAGGGVYVNAGATLFMYGKALIGDKLSTEAGITVAGTGGFDDYANRAQQTGGGGIYNKGAAYIGYSGFDTDGTTLIESSIDNGYGIIRNYNTNEGGGAIYNAGTLKIRSGSISYNNGNTGGAIKCTADATISGGTFTANKALSGGAIYVDASRTVTINGSATFTKNQASDYSGGAIYNAGTLTMTAGTIGEDGALNTATTSGGAIYQKGTFNMSGSAVVYAGTGVSEKNNDVYLAPNGTVVYPITVNATLNSGSSAKITPANWKRGMAVLDGGSLNTTNAGYFAVTDTDWSVLADSTNKGKIESAKIYVAGATGAAEGMGTPSSSGNGTKAKPFNSIENAAAVCWRSAPYTICVSGELKGAQQKIPSTVTASNASAITLTGLTGTNFDSINRNLTSESSTGNALVIGTAVPVTIEYLKITGGYTSTSGGGVLLSNSSGSLTIGTGALITKNTAKSFGGGIYAEGGLVMTAGEISNNTANFGGGISNKLTLSISGGEISNNKAVTTGGTAPGGGGIYLYGPTSAQIAGGMAKPEISGSLTMTGNSAEGGSGGAITVPNGYVLLMSGAANLKKNSAAKGGAISLGGVFNMTAGTIGGTTETDSAKADYKNTSSSAIGGAIYVTSVGKLRIGGNACVCYGGAIGTNDIYDEDTQRVEILSSLSKHTSSTKRIGLTLKNQSVGSIILFGDGLSAAQTCKFLVKKTGNYYIDNKGLLQQGIPVTSVTSAAVKSAFDSAAGDKVVIQASLSTNASNIATALKNTTASYANLDLSQITATLAKTYTKSLFKDCTKLKEVSLDLNTFTLSGGSSDATFSGCSSLETINVFGNAGTNWLSTAFYNTNNIKTINFVNATEISYSGREYLPSQYYTKNVTINLPSTLTKFILDATGTGSYTSYITIKYPGSFADFKSNVTISKGVASRDYGSVTFTFTSGTPTTATWKSAAAGTAGGSWQ